MRGPCMIGLLPHGEALWTSPELPLEEQKAQALEWMGQYENLQSVHAVVDGSISDITAAYCWMWMNRTDLSDIEEVGDFPELVRNTVPELVEEVATAWAEEAEGQRQLRSDYRAGAL